MYNLEFPIGYFKNCIKKNNNDYQHHRSHYRRQCYSHFVGKIISTASAIGNIGRIIPTHRVMSTLCIGNWDSVLMIIAKRNYIIQMQVPLEVVYSLTLAMTLCVTKCAQHGGSYLLMNFHCNHFLHCNHYLKDRT